MSKYRYHIAWSVLGIIGALGLWFAYTLIGAITLFASIGAAFLLWYRMSPRGSWMALITLGLVMTSVLSWQVATSARCPADGTKIFLKADKAPVNCTELRAGAGSMAIFFALITGIGIGAPLYAKSMRDAELEEDTIETFADDSSPNEPSAI